MSSPYRSPEIIEHAPRTWLAAVTVVTAYIGTSAVARLLLLAGEGLSNIGHGDSDTGSLLVKAGISGHAVSLVLILVSLRLGWRAKVPLLLFVSLEVAMILTWLIDVRNALVLVTGFCVGGLTNT